MNIVIGNVISFMSAMCMVFSCCSKDMKKVFGFQFLECVLLAVASVFFGTYAAVVTLLLSAARNIITAMGKFTRPVMVIFLLLVTGLGILTNNRGIIGFLPVIATLEYTVCCHYITDVKATKISILVNLIIWIVYSFIIFDFSTAVMDSMVAIVDVVVLVKGFVKRV